MNVLTSITVLGFLIFFHEMGHFLAAILQGIYVDGFSIGFGPSIIKKKYKDITYSFRAFPLGGFVSFPDEELNNIDPKDPNLLKNRPIIQRVIVISAGVLANLFLAYTILIINVTTLGIQNQNQLHHIQHQIHTKYHLQMHQKHINHHKNTKKHQNWFMYEQK